MCECLAPTRGRNATPPALSLPGPFDTARYRTTLATYLSQRKVRARISGRVRTRPGRIKPSFRKKGDRTVWDLANNTCGSRRARGDQKVPISVSHPPQEL